MTNIRNFPLAWRWTEESTAVLPDDVLAQMHPLEPEDAATVHGQLLAQLKEGRPSPDLFPNVHEWEATGPAGGECLKALSRKEDLHILISWQREVAIRTTWGIFRQYWDDFCYPSSDDVTVAPEDGSWVLVYDHEERFLFGERDG